MDSPSDKQEKLSAIAQRLRQLKSACFSAAGSRENLPQPLFWSLFNSQLREVKQEKNSIRKIAALFDQKD